MHLGSASKHRASLRCGWRAKEREGAAREQERGRSAGALRRKRGTLEGGRFKSSELFWSSSECKKEMGGPREGDEEIKRTKRGKLASAPKRNLKEEKKGTEKRMRPFSTSAVLMLWYKGPLRRMCGACKHASRGDEGAWG